MSSSAQPCTTEVFVYRTDYTYNSATDTVETHTHGLKLTFEEFFRSLALPLDAAVAVSFSTQPEPQDSDTRYIFGEHLLDADVYFSASGRYAAFSFENDRLCFEPRRDNDVILEPQPDDQPNLGPTIYLWLASGFDPDCPQLHSTDYTF